MFTTLAAAQTVDAGGALASLFDLIVDGGPVMIPIGLCSIVALAYIVERSIRLQGPALGSRALGRSVVEAVRATGASGGLERCRQSRAPLARVLAAGFEHHGGSFLEVEKAVEDAGTREVRRLGTNLRPLVVVAMIAPLLGLLGTVWGMIEAFTAIAREDGLGSPELLASGISQALVTTAAGLAVAIPTQAAYYWLKSRIDRFVRRVEDTHLEISRALGGEGSAA